MVSIRQLYSLALLCACNWPAAIALDNGLALTPPMGWRSWNCFQGDVSDQDVRRQIDAIVRKRSVRLPSGGVAPIQMSLLDLGYDRVGVDDGWQECDAGSEKPTSFHDAAGKALVNGSKFPDLPALAAYAEQQGVKLGWYNNNCICHESASHIKNETWIDLTYHGDVQQLKENNFQGIKIDSCGLHQDMDKYERLMNATGKRYLIERAAQGGEVGSLTWCPFHVFRSSGDIRASWSSVMRNLKATTKYLDPVQPVSRPGCWAYPDMMMVGNLAGDLADVESRSHFGGWAIVSSPLILGLDLTDEAKIDAVWPFISNSEAIAVNQQWAGHPGRMLNLTQSGNVQVWAKAQPGGRQAILAINLGSTTSATFELDLARDIGLTACAQSSLLCSLRDIWALSDAPITGTWHVPALKSHDSAFVVVGPASAASVV